MNLGIQFVEINHFIASNIDCIDIESTETPTKIQRLLNILIRELDECIIQQLTR